MSVKVKYWFSEYSVIIIINILILFGQSCNFAGSEKSSINNTTKNKHLSDNAILESIKHDSTALLTFINEAKVAKNYYAEMVGYNYLGNIYRDKNQFKQAIYVHKISLAIAESLKDSVLIIKSLNNLGEDYRLTSVFGDGAEYFFKILTYTDLWSEKKRKDVLPEIANALNGVGSIYIKLEQPEEASKFLLASLDIYEKMDNKEGQAINFAFIGKAYEINEKYDSALNYYEKALKYSIQINSVTLIAISYIRMGELYLKLHDEKNALIYLFSAYNTIKNTSDKLNLINICYLLGETYKRLGNYNKAEQYLNDALVAAKETKHPYYLEITYNQLADIHQKQGKTELALKDKEMSRAYTENLRVDHNLSKTLNNRLMFEKVKNENQLSKLNISYQKARQTNKISLLIILIILAGFLVVFTIVFYKNKLKKKESEQLIQMEKMRADFFMHITHEFKTPLSIILGLNDLLKRNLTKGDTPKNRYELDIVSQQCDNLMFLLDEILAMSKIKANKEEITYRNGDVVTYLRYLYNSFTVLTDKKQLNYVFHSNVENLEMSYPPEYLRVIVNNLLSNSIKHCSESDQILFIVRENSDKGKYMIEISDTGEGITAEDLPYVFDTFYQGHSKNMVHSGSGIGLAFTKQIIYKLNGTIEVKSEPGKETTFTVTLPIISKMNDNPTEVNLVETHVVDNSRKSEKVIEYEEFVPKIDSSKSLILIVEDSKDMMYYMSSILKDDYNLIFADNGQRGLELANEHVPDVIISDLVMPVMNGHDYCLKIKNSIVTCHIPFIIVTAKSAVEDRIDSFKSGADAVITKPFMEEELITLITQLQKNRKQLREKYSSLIVGNHDQKSLENNKDLAFLQQVTDIVYREITNHEFFPQGLASELCISASQLNRKLNAVSGLNCSNYVLQVRLNRAKKILIRSQKPIGEIAMECGFNDFAYFSRAFRKEFMMTPSQYQRLVKDEI
ncbi:MAG: tetratricopeptide repeat protein [Dysgonamonadaceae bacterium]